MAKKNIVLLAEGHSGETVQIDTAASESALNDLLCVGGEYNFKNQPERLKYIGKHNGWHQFEKIGEQGVWCELLDSDLHMIEETKDNNIFSECGCRFENDHSNAVVLCEECSKLPCHNRAI